MATAASVEEAFDLTETCEAEDIVRTEPFLLSICCPCVSVDLFCLKVVVIVLPSVNADILDLPQH